MTEQEARNIYHQGEEAVVAKFMEFDARLKRLEERLGMNSTNSSKPSSTDDVFVKPKKKQAITKSKNKRGAQKGHKGNNLSFSSTPDHITQLSPTTCSCCNHSLEHIDSLRVEKRQLFDLPAIKIHISEFQSHSKRCPQCNTLNKPSFPTSINAPVQYGDNLKSLVSYCSTYQMLPYERIAELVFDLSSHKISMGAIYNFLSSHHGALEYYEQEIKQRLLKEEVVHSDETGINIKDKLHWMHVASSKKLTAFMLHQKRGKEAMDDMEILPKYEGIVVHDHWSSYNHYTTCKHSYCNAHILRELNGISENENRQWSKDMHTLLKKMNQTVNIAKQKGKTALSENQIAHLTQCYEAICKSADVYYPPPNQKAIKTRGRLKKEKGKNLLDRLVKYQEQSLRFLSDFRVPFTNNQAERDLRMIKVKQKISGCFASFRGAEYFARIRGYISTLKKNNMPVLQGLKDALNGKAYVPVGVGC